MTQRLTSSRHCPRFWWDLNSSTTEQLGWLVISDQAKTQLETGRRGLFGVDWRRSLSPFCGPRALCHIPWTYRPNTSCLTGRVSPKSRTFHSIRPELVLWDIYRKIFEIPAFSYRRDFKDLHTKVLYPLSIFSSSLASYTVGFAFCHLSFFFLLLF